MLAQLPKRIPPFPQSLIPLAGTAMFHVLSIPQVVSVVDFCLDMSKWFARDWLFVALSDHTRSLLYLFATSLTAQNCFLLLQVFVVVPLV